MVSALVGLVITMTLVFGSIGIGGGSAQSFVFFPLLIIVVGIALGLSLISCGVRDLLSAVSSLRVLVSMPSDGTSLRRSAQVHRYLISKPESRFVVPFVGETNSNSVIVSDPELFDEAVIEFFAPLALQERDDFFTPSHELAPVAPLAVKSVGKRNTFRVAAIPSVLGEPHLLRCGFDRERRKRRFGIVSHIRMELEGITRRSSDRDSGSDELTCWQVISLDSGLLLE